MSRIDSLIRALRAKNNEFYTKYEDVEFFVENSLIKDYLKDKVVYLPCDSEDSNIYKYLANNKERLGITEILRTSDDYYGHQDLYDKCDVVFTNPPFTGIRKWLCWLDDLNIKYISWFPMMTLYSLRQEFFEHTKFIAAGVNGAMYGNDFNGHYTFDTPEGEKWVSILLVSNDVYFDNFEYVGNAFSKTFEDAQDKLFKVDDGYEVYRSPDIPNDYFDGYLYIPITAYIGRLKYFDYYGSCGIFGKDGKGRPRIKVKLKADEINKTKLIR